MNKRGVLLFSMLAVVLMLGFTSGPAFAQPVGDASVYFVTYFSNNVPGAPAAVLRVINDGESGANLYADYFVFDDSQELTECCSCYVTPDGINSESVPVDLTANPLTGKVPTRGVIKVISSFNQGPGGAEPAPGLHGFATHIQAGKTPGTYAITEAPLLDSNLVVEGEKNVLNYLCAYAFILGSGAGQCYCTFEDNDF